MKNPWITIKPLRHKKIPEIIIYKSGQVLLEGEVFKEDDPRYRNLSVNIEAHNKLNTGEETLQMLALQKEAEKGETITVSESKDKNKSEQTTIKF
ncbi:MAG TPA: hypothetical protein VFC74_10870 [Oscillospiraceae bacterium]|nr:hypothetical protein [Oscillospiraceae bacterium]